MAEHVWVIGNGTPTAFISLTVPMLMYIGSIFPMPRKFLSPEKGKTDAIFYNCTTFLKLSI